MAKRAVIPPSSWTATCPGSTSRPGTISSACAACPRPRWSCAGVAVDAIQLLGGYGCFRGRAPERIMRDAKIAQIYEGANQIQRLVVGRHVLDPRGRDERSRTIPGRSGGG